MDSFSLALPRPKAFVDTRVRVVCGLGAGQFFLHAAHTGAERLLARTAFRLWALQIATRSAVVSAAAQFTQAAKRVLVLFLERKFFFCHVISTSVGTWCAGQEQASRHGY